MTRKHLSLAVLALAFSAACTQPLHASPVISLNVDGKLGLLVQSTVAGVQEFAYTDVVTDVTDTMTTTFLATYADIAGIQVLNVTDTCVQVTVVFTQPIACQALTFSFTDVAFADLNLVSALGTASVDLSGEVAQIRFAANVGGGTAVLDFTNPPTPPTVTPEPASLVMLSTGLLGLAGVVRRRRTSL